MKTHFIKFAVLLYCLLATYCLGSAQNYPPYVPSPQTWDFMAYGNLPVSQYTGRLDLQIPIYHYKDKDFDIPIGIGYNSAGFVPSKSAGPIGLSWFLNYGGVITRRVANYPDEAPPSKIGASAVGQFLRAFATPPFPFVSADKIYSFSSPVHEKKLGNALEDYVLEESTQFKERYYETKPDIFDFNFLGHHGKFVGDPNGKIHVYGCEGSGTYQVDIAGMITDYYNSKIVIRTGDGYKYTFGGDASSLEYTYSGNVEKVIHDESPTVVSWYLSEIEAPNGRKVVFEYEGNGSPSIPEKDRDEKSLFVVTETPSEAYGFNYSRSYLGRWNFNCSESATQSYLPHIQVLKSAFIKEIRMDDFKVEFFNSYKEYKDLRSPYTSSSYATKTLKLDSLVVAGPNGVLKNVKFAYDYKGGSGIERLFLDGLAINNHEVYSFAYNNTEKLPDPLTRGVDYWGFWNGRNNPNPNSANSMIPEFDKQIFNSTANVIYKPGNVREPNTTEGIFNAALLKTITYPTGGSTHITYEPHSYRMRLERRNSSFFMPQLLNISGNGGGARVKKLEDVDSDGTATKWRTFDYNHLDGESGGILESWPIMALVFFGGGFMDGVSVNFIMQSSSISVNCFDDGYIGYEQVKESYSDGGYTTYTFSTYETNPDTWGMYFQGEKKISIDAEEVYPTDFYRHVNRVPNSHAQERGKLQSKTHYNKGGRPVESEEYDYENVCYDPVVGIDMCGDTFYSYRIHAGSFLPSKLVKTTYDVNGKNPIRMLISYEYDNELGLKTKESISESTGSTLVKYTRYPSKLHLDILPQPPVKNTRYIGDREGSAVYSILQELMPGIPLEQVTYRLHPNGALQFLSASVTRYKPSLNYNSSLNYYIPVPFEELRLSASDEVDSYTPLTYVDFRSRLYIDSRLEPEITYEKYDEQDNLLQARGRDSIPTAYLWGYKNLYPIAKIVNATYSEVSTALPANLQSEIGNYKSYLSLSNVYSILRKSLPNAHIHGYTYMPQVGLSSETGPDGLTTYYRYDIHGRLLRILDHDKKVVKQYEHHYANQNDLPSQELPEIGPDPEPDPEPGKKTIYISAFCEYVGSNCMVYLTASQTVSSHVHVKMRAGGGLGHFEMTIPPGSSSVNEFFSVPGDDDIEILEVSPSYDENYYYQ